jgi:two-component system response regulator YesN
MEALAGISIEKPDIIIMDVRMPGMSGLDTLREVNKILPDTISVLLTAYERFDIAQDAYALGVYRYLVKPVPQETLAMTIRGALGRLEEVKAAKLKAAEERERTELVRPLLEAGFIYTLLTGDPASPLLRSYGEQLGLLRNGVIRGHFAAIFKDNRPGFKDIWLREDETPQIRREITNRLDCVPGALIGGIMPIFVGNDKIIRTRDILKKALKSIGNYRFSYAIGSVRQGPELKFSWSEALEFIHQDFSYNNLAPSQRMDKQAIFEAVKAGNLAKLRSAFIAWALEESGKPLDRAIVAGALSALTGGGAEEILAAGQTQITAGNTETWEGAEHAAQMLIFNLSLIKSPGTPLYGDKRIQTALQFIDEHYHEQISLEDAAARTSLSPAHLSRLLSAETGATFTGHLSGKRIERACKELARGLLSIKEIAALCGYPDANYFSRAFKKVMGITPSEYAKKQGRDTP